MREIKFRFWGPFGAWIEPDEMEQEKTMLYGDEFAWEEYEPINDLFAGLENSDVVAMQYTGLKDKNGKEIYEGDIVIGKFNHDGDIRTSDPMKLVWGSSAWGLEYASGNSAPSIYNWISLEVIGNIYENPELLEDSRAKD